MLALADTVPPPQFAVNLLLASVHDLLLDGADDELGACLPSVAHRRGLKPRRLSDHALLERYEAFCRAHHEAIVERTSTRATQTNEVGRGPVLRAAIASLGADEPVALLDLGCSSGLNLFLDAYRCAYDGVPAGGSDPPLLDCALRGAAPPLALAPIASRTGLDLAPIDPADPVAARWLLACLWPDDLSRFGRLEAALALAAARRGEVRIVKGDMVEDLAAAVGRCERDARLVVLSTWAAAYLPVERRPALTTALAVCSSTRPIDWIAIESPRALRDLGVLPERAPRMHDESAVCVTRFERGARRRSELLGTAHHHGRWLDWWATPVASAPDDDA